MRYERKLEVQLGLENSIKTFLLCNGFREIFKLREVNSIYYDDVDYNFFHESEDGLNQRTKIRARYYDSGKEGYKLEYKLKNDNLNWKVYKSSNQKEEGPLIPLIFDFKNSSFNPIRLPASISNVFKPTILVSYLRRYFLSKDHALRATIDYRIKFSKAKLAKTRIDIGLERVHHKNVLELKYDNSIQPSSTFIELLCQEFNFDLSRSSKYCNGIRTIFP